MKKTIFIMLGFCFVLTVSAQKKKDNQSAKGEITKKAIIETDLTNEQREKLTKINRKYKKLRDQVERDTTLTADSRKIKIKDLQLEKQKKMREVLTDAQWVNFEKKRDSLKVFPKAQ